MNQTLKIDIPHTGSTNCRSRTVDLIKTLAIIGVIFIHTCTNVNSMQIGSPDWLVGIFYGSVTRASVPLFLMCSGALFLCPDRPLSTKKLYRKSIPRLLIAMVFWGTAYKAYHLLIQGNFTPENLFSEFKNVIMFNQEFHLYYIHIMLLCYAFFPIVRIFTDHASKRMVEYALALWFVLGILYPTVAGYWPFSLLSGIPLQWKMNMTYASVGYCLAGYYLRKYPIRPRTALFSGMVGLSIVYGGTVLLSIKGSRFDARFLEGMTVGVCLLAVGIFGICQHIGPKIGGITERISTYISKASFCIYTVHMFVLYGFMGLGFRVNILPCVISIPLMVISCLALSTLAYWVLSHIPIVKKWII